MGEQQTGGSLKSVVGAQERMCPWFHWVLGGSVALLFELGKKAQTGAAWSEFCPLVIHGVSSLSEE